MPLYFTTRQVHLTPGAGLTSCALDFFANLGVLYTHSHTNSAADWRVDWQVAVLLQIHAIDEVIRLFCGERQSFLQSATYKPEPAAHHQYEQNADDQTQSQG